MFKKWHKLPIWSLDNLLRNTPIASRMQNTVIKTEIRCSESGMYCIFGHLPTLFILLTLFKVRKTKQIKRKFDVKKSGRTAFLTTC